MELSVENLPSAVLNVRDVLEERKAHIMVKSASSCGEIRCEKESIAGSISQRACVYCGARVVLNPITDAVHLVHGPIGCASYTWDLRGSLSSDATLFRNSFSTDLREKDVIFGGEKKLSSAIDEIVTGLAEKPKLIFVYATCVVGVIGDDIDAICRKAEKKYQIRVIPVRSSGFSGSKPFGYRLACEALLQLMGSQPQPKDPFGVNILGDYNHGGEIWIIEQYLKRLGIRVIAKVTGDGTYAQLLKAPSASLNIIECSGSMAYLLKQMNVRFGIPALKVRFIGFNDIRRSLMQIAHIIGGPKMECKAAQLADAEEDNVRPVVNEFRRKLQGKTAAICVGGSYKAIALIRLFKEFGIRTVVIGTQHGSREDYQTIHQFSSDGAVILNDISPTELEKYIREKKPDIFVGNVKERVLALKMGIPFIDFNHDRKHPLTTYEGLKNLAEELNRTANSPVWKWAARPAGY